MKNYSQLLFLALLPAFAAAQPCREVMAFFPSWKWYNRGKLVNPATIDYSKYTALLYAFYQPNPDGSISPFDPRADKTLLLGEIDPAAPAGYASQRGLGNEEWHVPGTSLVDRAHEAGVKVLISVGGWTMSDQFASIAASEEKRQNFAHYCNQLVRTYRVDGVDIDWEYPAERDKENFTLLLQAVRDSFDFCQNEFGKRPLLTADFGAGAPLLDNIDWPRVGALLDFVNVMTYDYYGSAPGRTNHHSPLYAPRHGTNGYNMHSSIHHLLEQHGVPAEKINIGLAFFGRSLKTKGQPGLHVSSHRQSDGQTFAEGNGAPPYYQILACQKNFDCHWDDAAQVPYLQGRGRLNTFVTYDDERSIALKARYILDHGLAGAIVWDLMGDCVESTTLPGTIAETPLATALCQALCQQPMPGLAAFAERGELEASAVMLSPSAIFVEKQVFVPRIVLPEKKLTKKEERKQRKRDRRNNRNRELPGKYFDGGW